jgi:hypothetical protein
MYADKLGGIIFIYLILHDMKCDVQYKKTIDKIDYLQKTINDKNNK